MNWGVFVGLNTAANILALFVGIVLVIALLAVTFLTPVGFVIIPLGLFLGIWALCK